MQYSLIEFTDLVTKPAQWETGKRNVRMRAVYVAVLFGNGGVRGKSFPFPPPDGAHRQSGRPSCDATGQPALTTMKTANVSWKTKMDDWQALEASFRLRNRRMHFRCEYIIYYKMIIVQNESNKNEIYRRKIVLRENVSFWRQRRRLPCKKKTIGGYQNDADEAHIHNEEWKQKMKEQFSRNLLHP